MHWFNNIYCDPSDVQGDTGACEALNGAPTATESVEGKSQSCEVGMGVKGDEEGK
jgi:hypothetical protein